jgi:hypothetical protein
MKPLLLSLLFTALFLSVQISASAVVVPSAEPTKKTAVTSHKNIASMKLKEFQQLVGRKLTFKEKIAFLVLKHQMKRHSKDADTEGQLPFILGLTSIGLLVMGLFVPFVIIGSFIAAVLAIVTGGMATKKDSENRKAKAGTLMGWITLAALALLLILAAVVLASWSSW